MDASRSRVRYRGGERKSRSKIRDREVRVNVSIMKKGDKVGGRSNVCAREKVWLIRTDQVVILEAIQERRGRDAELSLGNAGALYRIA